MTEEQRISALLKERVRKLLTRTYKQAMTQGSFLAKLPEGGGYIYFAVAFVFLSVCFVDSRRLCFLSSFAVT